MSHPFIFLGIQSLILIGVFLAWPAMIKKIVAQRKINPGNPINPNEIQAVIRLRWRYGAWMLMAWIFFNIFNF